ESKGSVKRKPASMKTSQKKTGADALLSPELVAFRDELLSRRDPETFQAMLEKADTKENYDKAPNDLKYVIARMAPMLAFRGFTWRMAKLAEKSRVSQEGLLTAIRAIGEQAMLLEPDSQWTAYIGFVTIPGKYTGNSKPQFETENDFVDFLYKEVRGRLITAL